MNFVFMIISNNLFVYLCLYRHQQWLLNLGIENYNADEHRFVCSDHFCDEDFNLDHSLKKQLMPGIYFSARGKLKVAAVPRISLVQDTRRKKGTKFCQKYMIIL